MTQNQNFAKSVEFLKLIYPDGPWKLTSISVDKKSIDSRTFDPGEEADVLAWLKLYEKRNLYYSVNPPTAEARDARKAEKAEVASVHYLHVDLDPRVGEDVEEEQKRILAQLAGYRVQPTIVVHSGGGYNALWKLDAPIPIADGASSKKEAIERAVDVERRNWQFELDFSTEDHCRDISRILRLSDTWNRPNELKIAKGRVLALSRVESVAIVTNRSHEDTILNVATISGLPTEPVTLLSHSYGVFMATPHVSSNTSTARQISDNVVRVESLDHLKITEKLKVLVAQGFDPEEPTRWSSRSDALFFVCCELVREGLSDEVILGLITDSRYMISSSVLDKGSGMTRYAKRQVERARDKADNPLLAEMNDKFAVLLSYGAKTAILVEDGQINPHTGRVEAIMQSFREFKDRIKNYPRVETTLPSGKPSAVSAFEWWTSHPRRRQYKGLVFEPGVETHDYFNSWTGLSVAPIPGEGHLRFLDHVRENICGGDEECFVYLERWMARAVQHMRSPSMVAVVLLGERGTGKSVFCEFFGQMFDPHRHTVSDVNALTGKFNAHLSYCNLVVAEEAFDLKDKRHESVLKDFITGRSISVERKGFDRVQMPNYAKLIMTSNGEQVVPAGDHERRFFVLHVGNKRRQQSSYFRAIIEDQKAGGVSNLLHHLMSIDLTNFDVTQVPKTDALREQQEHNLALELEWFLYKLETGQWLTGKPGRWDKIFKAELHADYVQYMETAKARRVRGTRAFHSMIMREIPETADKSVYVQAGTTDRAKIFIFPPLERCRELFSKNRGWTDHPWPEVADSATDEKKHPFE